jgi:hypothetical protein
MSHSHAIDLQSLSREEEHDSVHFFKRAARHRQEAERLYRIGDSRQAEMHASISRKHIEKAMAIKPANARTPGFT